MRISDWSSDVCSSDLGVADHRIARVGGELAGQRGDGLRLAPGLGGLLLLLVAPQRLHQHLRMLEEVLLHQPLDRLALPGIEGRRLLRRDCVGRRSEEHTSELTSLMSISYAVF